MLPQIRSSRIDAMEKTAIFFAAFYYHYYFPCLLIYSLFVYIIRIADIVVGGTKGQKYLN